MSLTPAERDGLDETMGRILPLPLRQRVDERVRRTPMRGRRLLQLGTWACIAFWAGVVWWVW